ncbi:cation transport protein-domain-containing protein [Xylariaceae sp. FL0255]|nr:cation transport protein-domain-containing protein [Xylariaceae sp. FL0255]
MPSTRKNLVKFAEALRPSFISRTPHFNFITVHYFWIIGWTIIASILLFATGHGDLAYIDALTFAAGANTQAGLNTVNVNQLNTFQQVVLYVCALLCNPITINSSVVFLRLYWFEKQFQNVVREARSRRATLTKSRSKYQAEGTDRERGVNGRDINVVRDTGKSARMTNDGILLADHQETSDPEPGSTVNTSGSDDALDPKQTPDEETRPAPHIKFSNQVRRSDAMEENVDDDDEPVPLPSMRSHAEHIAILEKQRKVDKSVLRIPGPRDADKGALPEELDEEADEDAGVPRIRRESSPEPPEGRPPSSLPRRSSNSGERPAAITIEVPDRPLRHDNTKLDEIMDDAQAASHALDAFKFWKSRRKKGDKLRRTTSAIKAKLPTINPLQRIKNALSQSKDDDSTPYLSWQPTLGRNSAFVDLTEEQREELGGIEYRSLKTLALLLTIYFWGFSILGIITLLPWILHSGSTYLGVLQSDAVNPVWWGIWTANSAFMDLGFTLTPDSMNSFNTAIFPLLVMSILILLGNTGFPVALRFMIWVISLFVPRGSGLWEELRFLLDHPRRCFTLLFPSNATWWLFFTLVILNTIDLILFVILDLGSGFVAELPLNIRFLDGWFQASSTRTAGFSCVNLALIHPAVQCSYLIMMYISVFPVAISIRRTNVYEEKSLGVYEAQQDVDDDQPNISYVGTHLRRQLSFDLWYVFLGFFIISITEGGRIISGDFNQFAVLFEIVSAYGTVGLSLGYPNVDTSLCGQFSVLGKLVIIAMMVRGRHRGLPYGLDRAVLLPSENLIRKEAEDAGVRLQRRHSGISTATDDRQPSRRRSRSIDRGHLLTSLLHPGPAWTSSKPDTKSNNANEPDPPQMLRRHPTAPSSSSAQEQLLETPRRRLDTQPALDS